MSSEEQANTLRLVRLLNEGGTDALRNVFDAKFPPATLGASLASRPLRTTLQTLLKNKVLNSSQWDKLYPAVPGTPDSKTFDISLLYALLRNICGFKSPKDPLWTSNPPVADRSVEANIARVRWYRNDVIHNLASGVNDVAFQNEWTDISLALKDLGIPQTELDVLKDSLLDEKKYTDMLLEWKREEQLLQRKVDETLAEVKGMKRQLLSQDVILLENQKQLQCQIKEVEKKAEAKAEETAAEVKAMKQMMSEGQKTSKEEVLRKLAKINFTQEMKSRAKNCHPGTREWLFNKIGDWFQDEESESRVMIILGDPGMGKTVVAATVCQRMQTSGNLGGMHFCKYGMERYRNARWMLQSLANSLCNVLPVYRATLIDLLSHNVGDLNEMSVEELFCFLLQEPLSEVPAPKEPLLFVIDALDEADYHGRNELMDVMSLYFARLPSWLKFLVTSRSDVNTKSKLEDLCPLEITPDLERNVEDLELFLREKLQVLVPAECLDAILSLSLEKSQGQMLHAHCTIEFLSKSKDISWELLKSGLPGKISSWYKRYTDRLKQDLDITGTVFSRFLAALVSSREPLPTDMIPWLLKLEAGEGPRIVEAIEAVSSLLPLHEGKVHVFHKSFTDWLTEPQPQTYGSPRAHVTEMQGHQVLGEVCRKILESLKNKAKVPEDFSPCEMYALKHGLRHMLEVAEGEAQGMQLKNMLLDLEVLILKLNHCTVYDVIEEYGDCAGKMSPDVASKVEEIKHILRGNASFLSDRPQSIFEQVVNEAECDELISQAHELLEKDRYQHTWMEVINRKVEDKSEILAEVAVNTEIGDFEVSPDGKMLAVNAGSIFSRNPRELSLWSITSGKPIWRKTFTLSKIIWFQLCCTFSPDGSLILFGRLDQVFHLDGNLQPYFDGIHHEYRKCRFSYDGKRLLTSSEDAGLLLWDVDRQLQLHNIPFMVDFLIPEEPTVGPYEDFIFSHCGRYIVSVTHSRIFLWDSAGKKLDSIDMGHPCLRCRLDCVSPPSGGHLLFMSSKLTRVVFKISSSQLVKYNENYNPTVEFIFSRDGKQGTAIVRQSGQHVNEELSCCPVRVGSFFGNGLKFKFVDDGSLIKQPVKSNTLQVVRTSTGAEYKDDMASLHKSIISACTFSGEGSRLYTYEHSDDGLLHEASKVFAYDVNDRVHLQKNATTGIIADFPIVLTGGKVLVFYQCKCEVWDSDLNNVLWTWENEQDAKPLCAADEIGVFMGGRGGEVMACDVQTGHVKFTLRYHEHQVIQGWINHCNSRLITESEIYDPDMKEFAILWDVDSHMIKARLGNTHFFFGSTRIMDCSFSNEKHLVAVLYAGGRIQILNELSGNIIERLYLPSVYSTCFVHGTNLLAFADHASLFVVDVSNYDERLAVIRFMKPNSSPLRLCYSPCSRKFAVAGFGEILLVEVHLPNLVTRTGTFR